MFSTFTYTPATAAKLEELEERCLNTMEDARAYASSACRTASIDRRKTLVVTAVQRMLDAFTELGREFRLEGFDAGYRTTKPFQTIIRTVLTEPFSDLLANQHFRATVSRKLDEYATVRAKDEFWEWCTARLRLNGSAEPAVQKPAQTMPLIVTVLPPCRARATQTTRSGRTCTRPQRYGW